MGIQSKRGAMSVRLNGWQRIGVVLSALWLMTFLGWGLSNYLFGKGAFVETIPGEMVVIKKGTDGYCTQVDPEPINSPEVSHAESGWGPSIPDGRRDSAGRYCLPSHYIEGTPAVTQQKEQFLFFGWLIVAFVPLFLAWLLSYACVFCVGWIAAGFKRS